MLNKNDERKNTSAIYVHNQRKSKRKEDHNMNEKEGKKSPHTAKQTNTMTEIGDGVINTGIAPETKCIQTQYTRSQQQY